MSNPVKASMPAVAGRQEPATSKLSGKNLHKRGAQNSAQAPQAGGFREVMGKIAKEVGEGQKTMDAAMSARRTQTMDNAELIAFQAKMYRYTQVLELTGKVVDKSTQSFKYTLQSQQ